MRDPYLATTLSNMNRRNPAARLAESIASAIVARGLTTATVAEATDMNTATLNSRLDGDTEFTVAEIVHVGGFLRIPVAQTIGQPA